MDRRRDARDRNRREERRGGMSEKVNEILNDLNDILEGDVRKLVEDAEKFGEYLAKRDLSTRQIRGIYSKVQRMKEFNDDTMRKLYLLRPEMAYVAGRHGGAVKELCDVLNQAILRIDSEEKFENFKQFFEAVLAYHKYHGGGD